MKKALIGTTAIVAAGLIAGSATAADLIPAPAPEIIDDGFTVTWSGYIRSGFYVGDNDCDQYDGATHCVSPAHTDPGLEPDSNNTTVPIAGELQLFAEQTLANGMRVGGEIDFDIDGAHTHTVAIDELWLFLDTHIGQIRLGQKEGALDSLGGGSLPGWGAYNGSNDGPDLNPLAGLGLVLNTGSIEDISSDANKVTYLSPTMHGVSFAVSFTPDPDGENQSDIDINNGSSTSANQYVNEWSVGANAVHTYGDHTFTIAGGFTTAEAEKNNNQAAAGAGLGDVDIWKIAGSIGNSYGKVGGWYSNREFDLFAGAPAAGTLYETTTWGFMANVVHGDYTVGGGYTRSEDGFANLGGTTFQDSELDIIGFGATKALGTGVSVGANATVMDYEGGYNSSAAGAAGTRGTNADGWIAGVFAAIAF